jgi:predicted metal-binding membrane protein
MTAKIAALMTINDWLCFGMMSPSADEMISYYRGAGRSSSRQSTIPRGSR